MMDRRNFLGGGAALATVAATPAVALAVSEQPSLDAIARSRGLRLGTATAPDELRDHDYAELIARECSVIVGENDFKWKHIEQREGEKNFSGADALADFAKHHAMELRGHCFIWSQDNRIPNWLHERESQYAENGGEGLIAAMWEHADQLATRYPQISSWDAVNEMITPGRGEIRSSLLTRVLGEQAIDIGFAMLRAKRPDAQLVYNDYMCWERWPAHRDGVLRLLERALSRDVPIDAIGLQSHLASSLERGHDELAWRKFLEEIEGFGLKMLITELDCGDRGVAVRDPAARDIEVAAFTKGYLDLTLSFESVEQVVLWSISDRGSYLNRPQYPAERRRDDGLPMRAHPYDEGFRPKPMRTAIAAALAAAPLRTTATIAG